MSTTQVSTRPPNVATQTVSTLLGNGNRLLWDGEHAYLIWNGGDHVRTFPLGARAFKHLAIAAAIELGLQPPTNDAQWSAVKVQLEAVARINGVLPTPSVRVAATRGGGDIYLDLGGDDWRCVKVSASGWEVVAHSDQGPFFYRPTRMLALPAPLQGGSPDRLWYYLNAVTESERRLLLAFLVQTLWPRAPYPVLTVTGQHGSAKTTRVCVVMALTDPRIPAPEVPSVTSPRKPPRDERSVVSAAKNSHLLAFDNVSYLSSELADTLCRLSTGAELADRALYTDFDEAAFTAARPVILNGIPDVIGQSDLADRCVRTEAAVPAKRLAESDFWHDFRQEWPQMLGLVLNQLSAALRNWGAADGLVDKPVRMRNFARIGEAIGMELGWKPGSFTEIYADNLSNAAREIAENDVIFSPLESVLTLGGGTWTGTTKDLLTAMEQSCRGFNGGAADPEALRSRDWPASPKALANKLTRLKPALREHGVEVGDTRPVQGRQVRTLRTL